MTESERTEEVCSYLVRWRGKVDGPFDSATIRSMVKRSSVSRLHQVSKNGGPWLTLSEYPELMPEIDARVKLTTDSSQAATQSHDGNRARPAIRLASSGDPSSMSDGDLTEMPPPPPPPPPPDVYHGDVDYHSEPPPQFPRTSAAAVWSLVLGILSIVTALGAFTGIPAIICGHVARSNIRKMPQYLMGSGMALAGLILGYITTIITVVVVILLLGSAIAIPSFLQASMRSRQSACQNNLRLITGSKDQYALDHNNANPTTMDDLVSTYVKETPTCPSGGTYSLGNLGQDATCTISGHTI